jgi:hypothetical protein
MASSELSVLFRRTGVPSFDTLRSKGCKNLRLNLNVCAKNLASRLAASLCVV